MGTQQVYECLFTESTIVCLFACLFKVGISTDKMVYLKRSYAKGKKEKKEGKESNKMVVFPKQSCKRFFSETGESKSEKLLKG